MLFLLTFSPWSQPSSTRQILTRWHYIYCLQLFSHLHGKNFSQTRNIYSQIARENAQAQRRWKRWRERYPFKSTWTGIKFFRAIFTLNWEHYPYMIYLTIKKKYFQFDSEMGKALQKQTQQLRWERINREIL